MHVQRLRSDFFAVLHKTLINLYDPLELRNSPLIADLIRQPVADPTVELKKILHEAITSLMPDDQTPPTVTAWRVYELLNYRFIEYLSQKETSKSLSVSLRTVQRLEPEAIQILANGIAGLYDIDLVDELDPPPGGEAGPLNPSQLDVTSQEYRYLKAYPSNLTNLNSVLAELADFVQKLNRASTKTIEIQTAQESIMTFTKPALLRQALLTIISGLSNRLRAGKILMALKKEYRFAVIEITAQGPTTPLEQAPNLVEFFAAMQPLVQISGGTLESANDQADVLCFFLRFPLQKQYNLLVVDDNADAIRLVQKYLEGTPYTVSGIQQSSRVMAAIEQDKPDLVIMDVMLPERDGWLLLGQIRQLPTQAKTPVIISTILPQEFLADPLGANGFLRKPFTPQELQQVVERVLLKERE